MIAMSFVADKSTCLRFWLVITINASQREQRMVLPPDLFSMISPFSSLSSLLHVGQSLGSLRIVIISRMKTFLDIYWISLLGNKEYGGVNWHPAVLSQTSNRIIIWEQNVRYSTYFLIRPINIIGKSFTDLILILN